MLKPSLQLRVGQQLTMTPQLQQAIRLLQLPSLDLQAHVRETLETNVMLEAEDELALDAPLEAPSEGVREEAAPAEEKYAELDGNAVASADEREEPEVEIADEAWVSRRAAPRTLRGPARTGAATSATSARRRCRNSSSSSWNWRNCPPSTWRLRASSPTPSPTTGT